MCEPVTAIAIGLAAASAVGAVVQANQSKHAVESQLKEQQKQIDQQASSQTEDRLKAAREARAAARASAAESGVSGNSSDAVLNDIMFQASRDVSRIEKNRENGISQSGVEAKSRYGEINGQLTSSVIGSGMAATTAYSNYQKGKSVGTKQGSTGGT